MQIPDFESGFAAKGISQEAIYQAAVRILVSGAVLPQSAAEIAFALSKEVEGLCKQDVPVWDEMKAKAFYKEQERHEGMDSSGSGVPDRPDQNPAGAGAA